MSRGGRGGGGAGSMGGKQLPFDVDAALEDQVNFQLGDDWASMLYPPTASTHLAPPPTAKEKRLVGIHREHRNAMRNGPLFMGSPPAGKRDKSEFNAFENVNSYSANVKKRLDMIPDLKKVPIVKELLPPELRDLVSDGEEEDENGGPSKPKSVAFLTKKLDKLEALDDGADGDVEGKDPDEVNDGDQEGEDGVEEMQDDAYEEDEDDLENDYNGEQYFDDGDRPDEDGDDGGAAEDACPDQDQQDGNDGERDDDGVRDQEDDTINDHEDDSIGDQEDDSLGDHENDSLGDQEDDSLGDHEDDGIGDHEDDSAGDRDDYSVSDRDDDRIGDHEDDSFGEGDVFDNETRPRTRRPTAVDPMAADLAAFQRLMDKNARIKEIGREAADAEYMAHRRETTVQYRHRRNRNVSKRTKLRGSR